jgi:hypothetical protein
VGNSNLGIAIPVIIAVRVRKENQMNRKKRKRQKKLTTTKGWKFEKLLDEVRKKITHPDGGYVLVDAESLALEFRAKLSTMSRVISQLRSEQILGHPINYAHRPRPDEWIPTLFRNLQHPYWTRVEEEEETQSKPAEGNDEESTEGMADEERGE